MAATLLMNFLVHNFWLRTCIYCKCVTLGIFAIRNLIYNEFLFVCVEFLLPSQQPRSCRAGQLPINTVPGCI